MKVDFRKSLSFFILFLRLFSLPPPPFPAHAPEILSFLFFLFGTISALLPPLDGQLKRKASPSFSSPPHCTPPVAYFPSSFFPPKPTSFFSEYPKISPPKRNINRDFWRALFEPLSRRFFPPPPPPIAKLQRASFFPPFFNPLPVLPLRPIGCSSFFLPEKRNP